MPARRALSLVELIVVLGILAVLLGLLLPAVQQVRQAAARTRTLNQLRQVSLGLHTYLSANGERLPYDRMRRIVYPEPGVAVDQEVSVFEAIRESVGDQSVIGRTSTAGGTPHPAYTYSFLLNPSDPSLTDHPPAEADVVLRGSSSFANNPHAFPKGGRFGSTFVDGSSQTVVFTEHYARCGPAGHRTNHNWDNPGSNLAGEPIYQWHWPPLRDTDRRATFADPFYDDRRPGLPGAESVAPFQIAPPVPDCDGRVPQTPHRALSLAMADGSVRGVTAGVRPAAFWAAVTPAGGEVGGFD